MTEEDLKHEKPNNMPTEAELLPAPSTTETAVDDSVSIYPTPRSTHPESGAIYPDPGTNTDVAGTSSSAVAGSITSLRIPGLDIGEPMDINHKQLHKVTQHIPLDVDALKDILSTCIQNGHSVASEANIGTDKTDRCSDDQNGKAAIASGSVLMMDKEFVQDSIQSSSENYSSDINKQSMEQEETKEQHDGRDRVYGEELYDPEFPTLEDLNKSEVREDSSSTGDHTSSTYNSDMRWKTYQKACDWVDEMINDSDIEELMAINSHDDLDSKATANKRKRRTIKNQSEKPCNSVKDRDIKIVRQREPSPVIVGLEVDSIIFTKAFKEIDRNSDKERVGITPLEEKSKKKTIDKLDTHQVMAAVHSSNPSKSHEQIELLKRNVDYRDKDVKKDVRSQGAVSMYSSSDISNIHCHITIT